ncbi:Multidrug resistance efflux pump-like protein [Shewanella halifaxensis HAW-EB4]|uniref:Multidrug resistance efflux pump-like protein n=1 Tax=Shewanella halifaxensis (strain HAW-EB4) TaxID=458817 RepID=B0TJL2_SHEHH|nr:HlyD family efflux transporter periplasmic adaptor subunit [Shewanella halifaxensis]ABZ77008.1 Multidrug resistance efflux pump-like protein [Shewanella halifaxensis HAW-EB4]
MPLKTWVSQRTMTQLKSLFPRLSLSLSVAIFVNISVSSMANADQLASTSTNSQAIAANQVVDDTSATASLTLLNKADLMPLLLTGQVASVVSQPFVVPKAGDTWRYQIQWMLPEGSLAKPGQVVVIFDKSEIDNRIEQLEGSLLRVTAQEQSQSIELNAQLLQAKFELKQAKLELEKAELDAAIPADFIAAKDYADNQFNQLKAESELSKKHQALAEILDKRTASLSQLAIDKKRAELELSQALSGLEQLELRADIAGPMLYSRDPWSDKKYSVGDNAQIGRQVANIPALDDLEVIAWVNEVDVDRISIGEPVRLRLDSQSKTTLNGSINDISRQARKQPAWGNSNWFKISIKFVVDDRVEIIPGMSVLVETGVAPS